MLCHGCNFVWILCIYPLPGCSKFSQSLVNSNGLISDDLDFHDSCLAYSCLFQLKYHIFIDLLFYRGCVSYHPSRTSAKKVAPSKKFPYDIPLIKNSQYGAQYRNTVMVNSLTKKFNLQVFWIVGKSLFCIHFLW